MIIPCIAHEDVDFFSKVLIFSWIQSGRDGVGLKPIEIWIWALDLLLIKKLSGNLSQSIFSFSLKMITINIRENFNVKESVYWHKFNT